jgi:hypothetical protein
MKASLLQSALRLALLDRTQPPPMSGAKVYPIVDLSTTTLDGRITYASSGGKTYWDVNGVMQTAAANVWPLEYDQVTHAALGRSIWEARTNLARFSADLTQSNWVKTNCTATLNQTDLFGVSNAAASLTATAANATALQSVTRTASNSTYSVYLKRITGSGTVSITQDGGTTWTPVTLTSAFQRFTVTQSVTNPSFGVRLAVSGDVVGCTANQLEGGATAAGPYVPTPANATVTRALETAYVGTLSSLGYNPNAGTFVVQGTNSAGLNSSNANVLVALSDGTASNRISLSLTSTTNSSGFVLAAGATQAQMNRTIALGGVYHAAMAWQLNDFGMSVNGSAVVTDTLGTIPAVTRMDIGNQADTASRSWNGIIKSIQYYPVRQANATLITASA